MMYQHDVLRGHARRMKGIPTYAYWASLLDPRTKVKAAKLLTARERCMIWKDIQDAICSITETHTTLPNNRNQTDGPDKENNVGAANISIQRKGAASFLMNAAANNGLDDEMENISLKAITTTELSLFQKDKGCPLCDDDGHYLCPLQWLKLNKVKYPHVWELARQILSIPSTSAPSERFFSAASNLISKKRASLSHKNADMLLFLKANFDLVTW